MKEPSAGRGARRPPDHDFAPAENVPLMPEIRSAITRLWSTGQSTVMDLRDAPLGPQAERRLFDALQRGLAMVPPRQFGSCRIRETSAPCVWIVEHLDTVGDITAKFIEVSWRPGPLEGRESDDDADSADARPASAERPSGP